MRVSFIALLSLASIGLSFSFQRLSLNRITARGQVLYSEPAPAAPDAGTPAPASKGFGAAKSKTDAAAAVEVEKDAGTKTYEIQAKRGVPEYNIFLRPVNGTEVEWVPVGSMTIPRDVTVSFAVFETEEELLKGAFKLYPKLKAFWDVRKEKVGIFEYGHCLKAFPDEPIIVIVKEEVVEQKNFFQNWLGKITNPIDTTDLKNKGQMTINQNK